MAIRLTPAEINDLLREQSNNPASFFRNEETLEIDERFSYIVNSIGKKKEIFNSTIVEQKMSYDDILQKILQYEDVNSSITDKFRLVSGLYWDNRRYDSGELSLTGRNTSSPYDIWFRPMNAIREEVSNNLSLPSFEEVIQITRNTLSPAYRTQEDPINIFNNIISNVLDEETYEDHIFDVNIPFDLKSIENHNTIMSTNVANIESTYNFYIKEYESNISNIHDAILPNLYVFNDELSKQTNDVKNEWFRKHLSLYSKINLDSNIEYFDIYGKEVLKLTNEQINELSNKFSNLFISHKNVDLFQKYNSKKELFPMFMDISFGTDSNIEFGNILQESGLSSYLMNVVSKHSSEYSEFIEQIKTGLSVQDESDFQNRLNLSEVDISTQQRRVFDINKWYEDFVNGQTISPVGFFDSEDSIFLGKNEQSEEVTDDPSYVFYRTLMTYVFSSKLKELIRSRTRTYQEMLMGKKAYSETVFYRIEKRKDAINGEEIQNIWLPNSNKLDVINYIDTQVKYGTYYSYNIYAYHLVFGSKYSYNSIWNNASTGRAGCTVRTEPSLKLVEVPYYNYINLLLDKPPTAPDIEVIPLMSVADKIKFNINSTVGKYHRLPEVISLKEEQFNQMFRDHQRRKSNDPIEYESDDHSVIFQIFRIDTQPYSYRDFDIDESSIITISSDKLLNSDVQTTSISYIDNILPNKKYWYTFRSIDNHGNISYPSQIYEIENIDDNGSVYPIIKLYDLKSENNKELTRALKRLIQITPSYPQGLINYQKSNISYDLDSVINLSEQDTIFLGIQDQSLWGKKFKIRLTSKQTGKKIDLNIVFKHEHIKNRTNF